VVRTFAHNFRYVMVWLTSYDAELVGSDQPLSLDEEELARRIARPEIARDLSAVQMGSAEDFLSYFVLGDAGARAFGEGGVINTDDNLWLEFSAPESMGVVKATGENVLALARMRESIVPYLVAARGPARQEQLERWRRIEAAAHVYDLAHALHEWGATNDPRFGPLHDRLRREFPGYAPFRFLERQLALQQLLEPRLLRQASFLVRSTTGPRSLAVSAVVAAVSEERRALIFVDNDKRDIFGQRYFEGPADAAVMEGFARDVLGTLSQQYASGLSEARSRGEELPGEASIAERFRQAVAVRTAVR
jgi:spermidine synthase